MVVLKTFNGFVWGRRGKNNRKKKCKKDFYPKGKWYFGIDTIFCSVFLFWGGVLVVIFVFKWVRMWPKLFSDQINLLQRLS